MLAVLYSEYHFKKTVITLFFRRATIVIRKYIEGDLDQALFAA